MSQLHPKVRASANAGGVVAALVGLLAVLGVYVPDDLSTAVNAVVVAVAAAVPVVAGYLKSV